MRLIAGLGNPGSKYSRNRHNVGFMAVEEIAQANSFSPWRKKFQGQLSDGTLGGEKTILLKPETFMNLSGQSVGEAMRFYKLTPADVIIIHDEIDLAPGKLRYKEGGGHAGHNGLRSIHEHIGPDYARVRIGVGHPGRKEAVPGYVLKDFAKADDDWLPEMLHRIGTNAGRLATGNAQRFVSDVAANLLPPAKAKPPKPKAPMQPATEPAPKEAPKSKLAELLSRLKGDDG